MFCLVPWRVSRLPTSYSPPLADPIRVDQSLIHPTVHYKIGKKIKRKLYWLFIYSDDYWPLICSSDWLWQTTSQIRGAVYLNDLREHKHFLTYGLFEIIHLHILCLPVQYSVLAGVWFLWVFFSFFVLPPHLKNPPLYIFKFPNSPRLN